MKKTAIVVAPGRGTYNRTELGYLAKLHANNAGLIKKFDGYRSSQNQKTVTELDSAARFSGATHTRRQRLAIDLRLFILRLSVH